MKLTLITAFLLVVGQVAGCRYSESPKHASNGDEHAETASACWDGGSRTMTDEERKRWAMCELSTFNHDEGPMTPQRARQIAYNMKTHYKSSEECQAACERRECFAYQTDERRQEFACIIRCKADKDCPPALACNCDEESTECRSIVNPLVGKIHGFCLSGPRVSDAPENP